MATTRKFIKVFLASPGDLVNERKLAKDIVDELNASWGEELGCNVELVGWEDTISGAGRPQAKINVELEACEVVIGMMWKRWGTPPDDTGIFTSGFEEEFETSLKRNAESGRPDISLLLKRIDPELERDPGEELRKVLAFRERVISRRQVLFEQFDDQRGFERIFRRCITKYAQRHSASTEVPIDPVEPSATKSRSTDQASPPISSEGRTFLKRFVADADRWGLESELSSVDVAHLRLLGCSISVQGNDNLVLEAHDANLIYASKDKLELGSLEQNALINCGLHHHKSENVPIWHWLAGQGGVGYALLILKATFSDSSAGKVSAFSLMSALNTEVPDRPPLDRQFFLAKWFESGRPTVERVAALQFLEKRGRPDDLGAIRVEYAKDDVQTRSAAVRALLAISHRESRSDARALIAELRMDGVPESLIAPFLQVDSPDAVKDLRLLLAHNSAEVRRAVAASLHQSQELTAEAADAMLLDSDSDVRLTALLRLLQEGRVHSNEEAKKLLVRPGRSVLSLGNNQDAAGEELLSVYERRRLARASDEELERAIGEIFLNGDAYYALARKRYPVRADRVRADVRDKFETEFRARLARVQLLAASSTLKTDFESLMPYLRERATRVGLEVMCDEEDPAALPTLREALEGGFVRLPLNALRLFANHGEWKDASLITTHLDRFSSGRGGPMSMDTEEAKRARLAATALYSLGRNRLTDLFKLPSVHRVLPDLLPMIPAESFRRFSDNLVRSLVDSEHDRARKVAALCAVRALPKARVRNLLDGYISGDERRFYNAILWLDLGASLPAKLATQLARYYLSEMAANR